MKAPQKLFGSSLHREQISQVQFQENGFLASLFFEFFDGEVSLSLTPASDVNFGIVLKEGLQGRSVTNVFSKGFITSLGSLFPYTYCIAISMCLLRKCGLRSYLCWLP